MAILHPQFIKDTAGQSLVILPQVEYDNLLSELEDLEDIKAYEQAKANDNGERIPMNDAFKIIENLRVK
jgi:hypothetical protein